MIFERGKTPIFILDGYYFEITFMLGDADNYEKRTIGPLSNTTASLFYRFLKRIGNDAEDYRNEVINAKTAEMAIWEKDVIFDWSDDKNDWENGTSDTLVNYLTGIAKSDIELYKDNQIIQEIVNSGFEWVLDTNYDCLASIDNIKVNYIENGITYNVKVKIESDNDLYETH